MMIFKVRWERKGSHIHCSLFTAEQTNMTWAECGNFIVKDNNEFVDLQRAMSGVEFMEKEELGGAQFIKVLEDYFEEHSMYVSNCLEVGDHDRLAADLALHISGDFIVRPKNG